MSLGDKKRTKKNKKILIYSLVFVLLALIIGGAILFSGNNSNINSNVIATVNGEEINLDEVKSCNKVSFNKTNKLLMRK
jgi:CHASE3 domain sensor protein